jgi:AcrR family transcriptional regulator
MRTPWGDAEKLHERKLRQGGRYTRAEAERNQKERLFAALVATVAEKGFEATRVSDLVELSGVSRSSFYGYFDDKGACFLAAVDALTGPPLERLTADASVVADEASARAAFLALIEAIAAQPAAAKLCLVEIYAGGPEAVLALDRILDGLAQLAGTMYEQIPGREGMPPRISRAIVGGIQKAVYKRLLRGEEDGLVELAPQLWEWVLAVPPPPGPLRPSRRRWVRPRGFEERQAASVPADRVLRALAAVVSERGYQETTVAEVVERAHTSQRTFYKSFQDKEAAMVAALDSGSAQMLAAALPAFRRATDWPSAVYGTQEAMFRFAAEEPEFGRLGAVEMYAAGRRALEQRETVTALYALLYDFVKEKGPERLPELVPTAVYLTLSPFLGAERAYAAAFG